MKIAVDPNNTAACALAFFRRISSVAASSAAVFVWLLLMSAPAHAQTTVTAGSGPVDVGRLFGSESDCPVPKLGFQSRPSIGTAGFGKEQRSGSGIEVPVLYVPPPDVGQTVSIKFEAQMTTTFLDIDGGVGICDTLPVAVIVLPGRSLDPPTDPDPIASPDNEPSPIESLVDAREDRFDVDVNQGRVTLDVLANDRGSNIRISSVGPGSRGGTVVISGNRISYEPASGFFGSETFQYSIVGEGGRDTARVSVKVTAPTAQVPESMERIASELPLARAVENLCDLLTFQGDRRTFIDDPRTNPGQLTRAQSDLRDDLCAIVNEPDTAIQLEALGKIAGGQHQHSETLLRFSRSLGSTLFDRLSDLRRFYGEMLSGGATEDAIGWRGRGASPALIYLSRPLGIERGGGAGDGDVTRSRWGVFISGSTTSGDGDEAGAGFGFDYSAHEFTVGADYLKPRGSNAAVGGIALTVGSSDADTDGGLGGVETDTVAVSLYGTWFRADGWFVEGVLGVTRHDFSSTRVLDYSAGGRPIRQSIRGDTDGDEVYLAIGGGREIHIGRGYTLSTSGKINYMDGSVDGVREKLGNDDGFGLALETSDIDIESFRSEFDMQLSKAFSTGFGVLLPYLGGTWIHEFDDRGDDIAARFVVDPFSSDFVQTGFEDTQGGTDRPTIFLIPGDENDSNYFRLSAGTSAQFAGNKSAWISVTNILGLDDLDSVAVNLGFRWALP